MEPDCKGCSDNGGGGGGGACCVLVTRAELMLLRLSVFRHPALTHHSPLIIWCSTEQLKSLVEMEGSGLVCLLADDAHEHLARLYGLARRVDEGLPLLRAVMGAHVREQGSALVTDPEKVCSTVRSCVCV